MLARRQRTAWQGRSTAAVAAVALGAALGACGATSHEAPELPPIDSMEPPAFFDGTDNALTLADELHNHIGLAKMAVGGVTLAIDLALLAPRAIFAGTLTVRPEQQNDEWVWSKSFPLLGVETELYGSLGDSLELHMHVTGTRDNTSQLQDFVWFDGTHQRTSGVWRFYDPEPETYGEAVLRVDWERQSATDKRLVFTNVTVGREGSGDTLTYQLAGHEASMSIHDAKNKDGVAADLAVAWSTADGSGRMTANGDDHCWDSLANGQVNVTCP